ncbi:MAG TPA: 30S ribosomal protein S5, partial [Candidatus Paceibacterota bacterium]
GMGKAGDTTLAIDKALKHARKHMITVPLTKTKSIPRETEAKFASSVVYLKPAPGKGLAAGGSVRTVLDLAGVTDVNGKILSRSKNRFNNARAALAALGKLR